MGIRIRKVMGWALTDVATRDERGWHPLDDPRINADSPLLTRRPEPTKVEYLNFLLARRDRLKAEVGDRGDLDGQREVWALEASLDLALLTHEFQVRTEPSASPDTRAMSDPADCVIHQSEYGDPSVLLLRPVSMPDWARRDDALDYAQESLSADGMEDRAVPLPHAPYPYSGSYMDAATGKRLPDDVMAWVRLRSRLREPDLGERDRVEIEQAMKFIATEALGFESGQDALDRIAPCVPGEILALAEFGDLFTTEHVWRQLRPVLYTYWS